MLQSVMVQDVAKGFRPWHTKHETSCPRTKDFGKHPGIHTGGGL